MATYARGLTSQAVNLTHTTHWSEYLMYYVANACSNRNLCNWRVYMPGAVVKMKLNISADHYEIIQISSLASF